VRKKEKDLDWYLLNFILEKFGEEFYRNCTELAQALFPVVAYCDECVDPGNFRFGFLCNSNHCALCLAAVDDVVHYEYAVSSFDGVSWDVEAMHHSGLGWDEYFFDEFSYSNLTVLLREDESDSESMSQQCSQWNAIDGRRHHFCYSTSGEAHDCMLDCSLEQHCVVDYCGVVEISEVVELDSFLEFSL